MQYIPVIDLFAGPGGLGEGFSVFAQNPGFKIALSVEKELFAHQTLQLRAFFRQFPKGQAPDEYYDFLRGQISKQTLFKKFPKQFNQASLEAMYDELGGKNQTEIDNRIAKILKGTKTWILIGGPPCQAYSLVGRSRNKGNENYEQDPRHILYREYLRVIEYFRPPLFIMENVKGILSSKLNGTHIIHRIIKDLKAHNYNIYSFVRPSSTDLFNECEQNPASYVIQCEKYRIPQARHRLILLGIRRDCNGVQIKSLQSHKAVKIRSVLDDLPKVRSGLSKNDSKEVWYNAVTGIEGASWLEDRKVSDELRDKILNKIAYVTKPQKDRGSEFIESDKLPIELEDWFYDPRIGGVCNHTTRGHIEMDLHRYFFASCFAEVENRSPVLADFPEKLLPKHKNAKAAIADGSLFSDRFRVQLADRPSTTVTSHISKDGHYYIHYDPTQCRSLTVREAARLQTFPDNYFFCGPRTAQYQQVGNAVPPYLAYQIADIVWDILKQSGLLKK